MFLFFWGFFVPFCQKRHQSLWLLVPISLSIGKVYGSMSRFFILLFNKLFNKKIFVGADEQKEAQEAEALSVAQQ